MTLCLRFVSYQFKGNNQNTVLDRNLDKIGTEWNYSVLRIKGMGVILIQNSLSFSVFGWVGQKRPQNSYFPLGVMCSDIWYPDPPCGGKSELYRNPHDTKITKFCKS